ncbi:MAG: DUF4091 domain-containing protein [Clostridia bacterium]|nr:DUF4091 domain-containing protein [Clostridia bacterium]
MKKQKIEIKAISAVEKVLAYKTPKNEEYAGVCLTNSRYNFQVALRVQQRLLQCKIKAESDLGEYIQVREVQTVPVNYAFSECLPEDKDVISKKAGAYPDLLVPLREMGFSLLSEQWKAFYITVTANDGKLPAGRHELRILLTNNAGEVLAKTTYVLEVLSDELPKLPIFNCNWMHYDSISHWYQVPVWSEEFNKITDTYIQNLVNHGGNVAFVPLFTPPLDTAVGAERKTVQLVGVTVNDGEYIFDFEPVKAFIRRAQNLGMEYFELSHLFTQWGGTACPKIMANVDGEEKRIFGWDTPSIGDEYVAFLKAFLPALMTVLDELGVREKTFVHLTDEPNTAHIEQYAKLNAIVRSLVGDTVVMDALSHYEFHERGLVPMPVVDTGSYDQWAGKCDNFAVYYCCGTGKGRSNRFIVMPALRTRILGFQVYNAGSAGFLHWGYNFWNAQYSLAQINPFVDNDALGAFPAGDGFLVYPGEDGPMDSIRNELMSDAWQDYRLALLAEKYVGKAAIKKIFADYKLRGMNVYPHSEKKFLQVRARLMQIVSQREL